MKRLGLKSALLRSVLMILSVCCSLSISAQYYQMVVHTDDGLTFPFNTNRVNDVQFILVNPDDSGNNEDETTVTGSATEITNNTATITSWANILDNLSTDLKIGIIYTTDGTPTKSNGTQITVSKSSLGSDAKYTVQLTNLSSSTTYYYRSFVYQSGVWFYGNVESFTTTNGDGVELLSGDVCNLTCYSAKVNATAISTLANLLYGKFGICYGTDSEPELQPTRGDANSKHVFATSLDHEGNYSCQLCGLAGSTIYYYRSFAIIDGHSFYGPIRSFTTKDDDVVITGDIDTETFTVKSTLKIASGAYSSLELGVCYGTTENPTVNDITITTNEVDDESNFVLSLKDIPFGTVYYRAFVKIDGVAHYGETKHFFIAPKDNGSENGYDYIEMGLSVKWASFNVGATKPEEYGDYFAWGETETKSTYNWSTYMWCAGLGSTLTKYCSYSGYGYIGYTDTKTTLDLEDDAAHVQWGGSWRMPTKAELDDLRTKCTWTWYRAGNTEFNGVAGYKVTSNVSGYTDRSIFLPAAGLRYASDHGFVGSLGFYWSSSLYTDETFSACSLDFNSGGVDWGSLSRDGGVSVRPVCQ